MGCRTRFALQRPAEADDWIHKGVKPIAVYGYVRVSTFSQAEEGQNLGVQERQIRGDAQILALEVDRVFVEEGVSGSKPLKVRPHGVALLAALQPGDTIITAKLDCIFRSALDALEVLADLKDRSKPTCRFAPLPVEQVEVLASAKRTSRAALQAGS
jgi:hypothetical protein